MRIGRGFTLLLGGVRSGKSDLAVQFGLAWPDEVVLIATAGPGDEEMARRIARHQEERPDDWAVIEAPLCSANDVTAVHDSSLLILDCVTMLVANLMFAQTTDDEVFAHATMLADTLAKREGPSIVVSNEVGMGVHPETELGRNYRDVLGRVNRHLAEQAESTFLIAAGRVAQLDEVDVRW